MSWFNLDRRSMMAGLAGAGLIANTSATADHPWLWAIDYSADTDPMVGRKYDLLVLEPDHLRPVSALRGPKTQLLGYISLGEVEQGRDYVGALQREGALQSPNPNWPDARTVDLRHPAWIALVINRLVPEILSKGYDGIFLDTLDNAEDLERKNPITSFGMIEAAADLVHLIRASFPDIMIMMNRGYAMLPRVASDIDVLLGEAMASRWNFSTKRYEFTTPSDWAWQADRMHAARNLNPRLRLATLDYWDPADLPTIVALYQREKQAGFHPYVATLSLDRIHSEPRS